MSGNTLTKYIGKKGVGVIIPNGVTGIGDGAFVDTGITSVTIPNSVKSIGGNAFAGTAISSITIPDSVTNIESAAFLECRNLTTINVDSGNANLSSSDGILFNKNKTVIKKYPAKKTGSTFTIPNGVTTIEGAAFDNCTSLTSITIPNSVTKIEGYAFIGCTNLTSITIPNGVTAIGDQTFAECTKLASITIPNGVTGIYDAAFRNCTSLASITIPASVTYIGFFAFNNCTSLTSVTFQGGTIRFGGDPKFPGNLRERYTEDGSVPGTYTRARGSNEWQRQAQGA